MSKIIANQIENVAGTETHNVDTMGIVSGSNANGNYIKYPDGTMICTKTITQASHAWSSVGSGYLTSTVDAGDYAHAFVGDIPSVSFSCHSPAQPTLYMFPVFTGPSTLTGFGNVRAGRLTSITAGVEYRISAIGRWK